jgi:3-dehydrotetronate 4-kinase
MLLGCIADDFTGASDLANTLARGVDGVGMATIQFIGVPEGPAPASCEAGVVALKSRSIPVNEAIAQSLAALDWLLAQGARQILFKYCSTFDSTRIGNIGPVAMALSERLGARACVVCPVFPGTGRTLYMGHLFVNDRLLNESGMENHPLTPMPDPDIRRWLSHQTAEQAGGEIGLVPFDVVAQGAAVIRAALDAEAAAGRRLVVVDALSNADLVAIGEAVATDRLVTGGSGIALGLPANFRAQGLLASGATAFRPNAGPGLVLCGSCSAMSNAQVAAYARGRPAIQIDPEMVMEKKATAAGLLSQAMERLDEAPLIYSTATPDKVQALQGRFGREAVAERIEATFGEVARLAVEAGVTRLVVGGGETSGAVIKALGVTRLAIGPEIDPGVPALAEDSPRGLALALKSGNFGSMAFFAKALGVLAGETA